MKINEVCTHLKTYIATVRVVLKNANTTARTTISAECSSHAYLMLNRLFGLGNVLSLSEVINENSQIEETLSKLHVAPNKCLNQVPHRENDQSKPSQVTLQKKSPSHRRLSTRAIATPIKHDLVQDMLTKQFMRQSNIVKPTSDDIRIAKNRAETALKRADLDYERAADEVARRQARRSTLKQSASLQPMQPTKTMSRQSAF
jgi:hypothetical protein